MRQLQRRDEEMAQLKEELRKSVENAKYHENAMLKLKEQARVQAESAEVHRKALESIRS